jgi:hypothetical protein
MAYVMQRDTSQENKEELEQSVCVYIKVRQINISFVFDVNANNSTLYMNIDR